ncbi:MipA/OmpV family protein [Rhizorhabdus phycosphaerae]|uniref:MipA/OmpV family protein n=1 Tax=Rhizorhabdus phycosphaerae TaxID=2711156 RepID=UPI0013EA150B|nr:MipA/OmpV family protein [Rhizorhabdus phycosphaerae]
MNVHNTRSLAIAASLFAGALWATAAIAQDVSGVPDDVKIGGDRISIGVGLSSTPTYIGSSRNRVLPTLAIQGQMDGYAFNSSGTALYLDLIRSKGGTGWKPVFGPLLAVRLDRHGHVGDRRVDALDDRAIAVEPGLSVGIQRTGVITSPYDSFSASISWQRDVAGAHGSYVVSPELDYDTPLSERSFVSVSASADYVGRGFGGYYYDIGTSEAAASGLRPYDGAARAGWKDWNLSATAVHSLTGMLTHGWGLFATAGYQRILGAYRRSPLVEDVGDANQWSGAIGIEYSF